jgi:mycothiol synthase
MTITLRPYIDDDLPNLQATHASWIQQAGDCGYCHVGDIPHRIYNGNRGRLPQAEIIRLWENDGEIIGYVMVAPYYNGYDAFVSPVCRGTDTEREVLQWGYETSRRFMNQIERADKAVMTDVVEGDIHRAQLLVELGFEKDEHWLNITERSLEGEIAEPVLPEGFSIRASTLEDYEQLAAVHSSAFGSNWSPELYRDEVMLKPGYAPEREIVVVAPDGRFAAFTVTWLDEVNKIGYFEPVGVHAEFQRMGLGRAVMLHAMHEFKALGMKTAMVDHATDNPSSSGLYNNIGFRTKHKLTAYKKM